MTEFGHLLISENVSSLRVINSHSSSIKKIDFFFLIESELWKVKNVTVACDLPNNVSKKSFFETLTFEQMQLKGFCFFD